MEPELNLYTIADLRAWLIDNNPPAGLSEQVIAPVRAYAILNNPYVKEEDAVVAAIYVGDELAAFTAAFPDMIPEGESLHHTPYTLHQRSASGGQPPYGVTRSIKAKAMVWLS